MSEKQIKIYPEQMQKIARYEMTFREIIDDFGEEELDIFCPEVYSFTLEDLYISLKALHEANPTIQEFGDYWFYPITRLSVAFGLDRACGELEDFDDVPEELKGYPGLNFSDSDVFSDYWWELKLAWEENTDETHLGDVLFFDTMIADLERYLSNRGKPLGERTFSDHEMEDYIRFFEDGKFVDEATEAQLELARKFTEILCAKDNGFALHLKGYACYGGNRLYPCDWPASRDCMIRLFEMKDDPYYANTLGYIYYYGRCTDGVPEYDKAFYYFGIAAANGIYEGMYKLADMFVHGYGCKESKRTARALYGMVYEDSKKHFLKGVDSTFADAALRMGNVYAKGIGAEEDVQAAFYYYTQAEYAAKIRAKDSDFFGNTTVVINAQKAVEETQEKLPGDYFHDFFNYEAPYLFSELTADNNRCVLTKHMNAASCIELQAERTATRSCPAPDDILLTIPQLGICNRTKKLSLTLDEGAEVWFADGAGQVRFDYCAWNGVEDRFEFWYDEKLTAWTRGGCRLFRKPNLPATGPEYRIASVCFKNNGRTYDYICELEDVKVGDIVIVDGYDGETEVMVTKVTVKRESELGLPVERYKKIKRKV